MWETDALPGNQRLLTLVRDGLVYAGERFLGGLLKESALTALILPEQTSAETPAPETMAPETTSAEHLTAKAMFAQTSMGAKAPQSPQRP